MTLLTTGSGALGIDCGMGCGVGVGRGAAAGRDASLEGAPPGPPGRSNFPEVIGLPATCFGLGVGFETELAGSPGPVRIVPLLYTSSRATEGSLAVFTTANFPGFLLYSILICISTVVSFE